MEEFQLKVASYHLHAKLHPCDSPRGVVIVCHGLGEHFGRYDAVTSPLSKAGFICIGADHPGHGQSTGKRGDLTPFHALYDEILALVEIAHSRYKGLPVFLYGHSFGGNMALGFLLRFPEVFKAAIITSPWITLPAKVPWYKQLLAAIVGSFAPGTTAPNGLDPKGISQDEQVVKSYLEDPLVHDKISVRLFDSATENATYILHHARQLATPTLVFHGSSDPITSAEGSKHFVEKSGDSADLVTYPEMYHELHHEKVADDMLKKAIDWLNSHS